MNFRSILLEIYTNKLFFIQLTIILLRRTKYHPSHSEGLSNSRTEWTPTADPNFQFTGRILWLSNNLAPCLKRRQWVREEITQTLELERSVFNSPVHPLLSSFEASSKLHKHLNLSFFIFKIGLKYLLCKNTVRNRAYVNQVPNMQEAVSNCWKCGTVIGSKYTRVSLRNFSSRFFFPLTRDYTL